MTKAFVRMYNQEHELQISDRTLRRKYKDYQTFGVVGLADLRKQSARKGRAQINQILVDVFCQWWLDEAKPHVSTVYRMLNEFCRMQMPELLPLPDVQSFYRLANGMDYAMVQYFREGNKAFEDKCQPYLRRTYEDIDANDIWSSDYHTLDLFARDDVTGKVFRPHAAVWIDIRSRKILSVVLMEESTSDGVIAAFRKAAERWGLPRKIYLDNGKEYLNSAFGGRGRRKTDAGADYGSTILERCGVEMYNAAVKNAKTKIIERIFRDVTNDFSKLVSTYTGGRPEERPERMNHRTEKLKNVPLLSEIRRKFEAYVEGIYNEAENHGAGMHGRCPNDVYAEHLFQKRVATKEELNLMLLRSARLQKVGRNGVFLRFGETVLDYYDEQLVTDYEGAKVYVRYDIEHLGSVRVYDDREVYICEARLAQNGGYALGEDTNLDAIKELNHKKKERRNAVIAKMKDHMSRVQAPDMLEVMEQSALAKMEEVERSYQADILVPVRMENCADELDEMEEEVEVDLGRMAANAARAKLS